MNKRKKNYIFTFVSQLVERKPLLKQVVGKPVKDIIGDADGKLDDIPYYQCLQELSRHEKEYPCIKEFIDGVTADIGKVSFLFIIKGKTQRYFLLGDDIRTTYEHQTQQVQEMCSFAETQYINDRKISDCVHDSFVAMIDSLSVYPREDFLKKREIILRYCEQHDKTQIFNNHQTESDDANFATLLNCYEKIKNYENTAPQNHFIKSVKLR